MAIAARGLEFVRLGRAAGRRDDELGQIRAAFDRMLRGRTQVVSLIGEAGIGKSRLLSEFLLKLSGEQLQKATVRRTACSSLGEQAYGIFADILREAYDVAPDDTHQAAQSKLTSGLRALGADENEATSIAPLIGLAKVPFPDRFRGSRRHVGSSERLTTQVVGGSPWTSAGVTVGLSPAAR